MTYNHQKFDRNVHIKLSTYSWYWNNKSIITWHLKYFKYIKLSAKLLSSLQMIKI